jgi:hypothetical protein
MSTETAGPTESVKSGIAWGPWLRVAGIAAALLVVSEAVWLWQTWPVRELLQPAVPALRPGAGR